MFEIVALAETDSTNDDAAAMLGATERAGTVLVADFQRRGRGRHARAWIAPRGSSLLFTAILPRPVAANALWAVPFWAALGVADGIAAATDLHVDLQWPNDLLLDGAKCAGILCVSRVAGHVAHVGCGVGLNVARPIDDAALAAVVPPPAFLSDRGATVERSVILAAILAAFERRIDDLARPRDIADAWERRAALLGTRYRLLLDGTHAPLDAIARRIGDDGSLVVDADGREQAVNLADARVLRG